MLLGDSCAVPASCYMRDSPETWRGHVPPRCLFPAVQEIGQDLRLNLITVPSCDAHNSHRSKDDEFLRTVITMFSADRSAVGRVQYCGKLSRGLKRRQLSMVASSMTQALSSRANRRALQIDRQRFDGCVNHIASTTCSRRRPAATASALTCTTSRKSSLGDPIVENTQYDLSSARIARLRSPLSGADARPAWGSTVER